MMANPEHLAILKQGVEVWNEWRGKNLEVAPDLCGAELANVNLSAADLRRIHFIEANLCDADLSKSNLSGADLVGARLNRANLTMVRFGGTNLGSAHLVNANLEQAHFLNTNLVNANLSRASLTGSILTQANLERTDFDHAHIGGTIFGDVDLSAAKNLDTVRHFGPSTLGIDTIYRSQGNVPEVFLRGCGVPETFITYAHSLVGKPLDFYSCFISHSSKDKRFCERLYADLQAKSVRVWYFPEDAKWGEPVWGEIDRSIKIYDKLIVVCSKNSLTSGPVLREIERALSREDKEHKNILFPITIDNYLFGDWNHPRKADVLAKVVGDFRGWNRSAAKYDAAFKKLLKALKAN